MILVDTSVWIDFFTGKNTSYRHVLHRLIEQDEDICTTAIVITEILQGIKDDSLFLETKEYLLAFPVVSPKGLETYVEAAEIFRVCRKRGKTVRKTVDCIIAAIVRENKLSLLHNDRDFDAIAECTGIKVFEL